MNFNPLQSKAFFVVIACAFFNFAYYCAFFYSHRYLPAPFVWNKFDTFMDFYNPLFWVSNDGFYTVFDSVYPALNFYILKLFSLLTVGGPYESPADMRNANLTLSIVILLLDLAILAFVINIGEWKKIAINKSIVFLALALSAPFLFGLERGNLIFLALFFLALFFGISNVWLKALIFAILVNIKPYFFILAVQYCNINQFDIRSLLRCSFLALLVFFVLGILAGVDFIKFFATYLRFAGGSTMSSDGILAMPNSLLSLTYAREYLHLPTVTTYRFWFSLIKVLSYLGPLALLMASIFKPLSRNELIISSLILVANFSIATGGYIYIIYIILIPYLIFNSKYSKLIILLLLIFFMPVDWVRVIEVEPIESYLSYLGSGLLIEVPELWIGLSSLMRPVINFLMMATFAFTLLRRQNKESSGFSNLHI